MSWCRWSSMEFACDLYVFESDGGVEVNVARGRHVIDRSTLPDGGDFGSDTWYGRHKALMDLLHDAPSRPIDLPHAGESRTFDDLTAAAEWIDELEALGYMIPPGMTDDMRAADSPTGHDRGER